MSDSLERGWRNDEEGILASSRGFKGNPEDWSDSLVGVSREMSLRERTML